MFLLINVLQAQYIDQPYAVEFIRFFIRTLVINTINFYN